MNEQPQFLEKNPSSNSMSITFNIEYRYNAGNKLGFGCGGGTCGFSVDKKLLSDAILFLKRIKTTAIPDIKNSIRNQVGHEYQIFYSDEDISVEIVSLIQKAPENLKSE